MKEITLNELYEVITMNGLWATDSDGEREYGWTEDAVAEVLTDLNKLGYKIVKE